MQKYPTDVDKQTVDWEKLLDAANGYKDRVKLPVFLTAAEKFFFLNKGYITEGKEFGEYASDKYKIKRMDGFIHSYRQSANWIKKNSSIKDNIFKEAAYLIGVCSNRVSFGSSSIKFNGSDDEITIYIDSSGKLQYERS